MDQKNKHKGFGLVKSLTWGELINTATFLAELPFSAFSLQQVQMFVPTDTCALSTPACNGITTSH